MTDKIFTKRLRDLTDEAIRESLAEISVEFEKRFGPAALTASPPVVERELLTARNGIMSAAACVEAYGSDPNKTVFAVPRSALEDIAREIRSLAALQSEEDKPGWRWDSELCTYVRVDAIAPTPVAQGDEVRDRLLEALTPHGETKAAYMGEFSWTEWLPDENSVEQGHVRTVPWTTIKEIMAAIRDRASVEKLDEADALATLTKGARDAG